jgi:hypothetical protein
MKFRKETAPQYRVAISPRSSCRRTPLDDGDSIAALRRVVVTELFAAIVNICLPEVNLAYFVNMRQRRAYRHYLPTPAALARNYWGRTHKYFALRCQGRDSPRNQS